jgi:hypothetical protein
MRPLAVAALLPLLLAVQIAGCVAPQAVNPQGVLPLPELLPLPSFGDVVVVGDIGNEPVLRVAPDGTIYVGALHHVYVSTDEGMSFREVNFLGALPMYASDTALSIAPDGRAYVAFDWPYVGQTAVCNTTDRGETWDCVPIAVPGATDRMWILAPTEKDAYLITGQLLDRPTFAVTHDAGATWTVTSQDLMTQSQGADLAWDPVQKLIVEAANDQGNGWGIRTWQPDGTFVGFTPMDVAAPPGGETVMVDAAGTWWATACAEGANCPPAVAMSKDQGKTWNVTAIATEGKTFLLPYVAAGAADRVITGWYETAAASADDTSAEWRFVVSQTKDGRTWNITVLTPEPVHVGAMCSSISCLGEARFAGDFIGLAFDSHGDAYATWNRQVGQKIPPTTQLQVQKWEQVEFARTGMPPMNATGGHVHTSPAQAPLIPMVDLR